MYLMFSVTDVQEGKRAAKTTDGNNNIIIIITAFSSWNSKNRVHILGRIVVLIIIQYNIDGDERTSQVL